MNKKIYDADKEAQLFRENISFDEMFDMYEFKPSNNIITCCLGFWETRYLLGIDQWIV